MAAAFVAILVILSIRISRYWTTIELLTLEEYSAAAAELQNLESAFLSARWFMRPLLLRKLPRFVSLAAIVRFHKMRLRFIAANSLHEDFNFS